MENHTAKHFVLQLGSLISLYLSISFLLVLIFGLVNIIFPDATESVWEIDSASDSVRIGIAMTLVFFPAYLILTRMVNKARRKENKGNYLGLTKWLIYLSLLVGGGALLVDLVVVINTFLEGEITERFILKAVAVLVVVGASFYYYLLDSKGYWLKQEKKSVGFGIGAIIVVVTALVFGFLHIETPTEVREQKLDDTQLSNLQDIQWHVQDYLSVNNKLPETIEELYGELPLPVAPENRQAYQYEKTDKGFKLCAAFSAESKPTVGTEFMSKPIMTDIKMEGEQEPSIIVNPDNWEHGAGDVCFERIVR